MYIQTVLITAITEWKTKWKHCGILEFMAGV